MSSFMSFVLRRIFSVIKKYSGHFSWVVMFLFVLQPLWMNDRPIMIIDHGQVWFPCCKQYTERDFGGDSSYTMLYDHSVATSSLLDSAWVLEPYIRIHTPIFDGGHTRKTSTLFGRDFLGYDIFFTLIKGLRFTFLVVCFVVMIAVVIGALSGMVMGVGHKYVQNIMQAMTDVVHHIPFMVVVWVCFCYNVSLWIFVIILGVFRSVSFALLVRTIFLHDDGRHYLFYALRRGVSWTHCVRYYMIPKIWCLLKGYIPTMIHTTFLGLVSLDFFGLSPLPFTGLGSLFMQLQHEEGGRIFWALMVSMGSISVFLLSLWWGQQKRMCAHDG